MGKGVHDRRGSLQRQKQVVFEALGLGAKDFIVKPFEADRVIKAIKRLFK